jgi:hypothetical protein
MTPAERQLCRGSAKEAGRPPKPAARCYQHAIGGVAQFQCGAIFHRCQVGATRCGSALPVFAARILSDATRAAEGEKGVE